MFILDQDEESLNEMGWCSWCLLHTQQTLVQPSLIARNVYKCSHCHRRTLACRSMLIRYHMYKSQAQLTSLLIRLSWRICAWPRLVWWSGTQRYFRSTKLFSNVFPYSCALNATELSSIGTKENLISRSCHVLAGARGVSITVDIS